MPLLHGASPGAAAFCTHQLPCPRCRLAPPRPSTALRAPALWVPLSPGSSCRIPPGWTWRRLTATTASCWRARWVQWVLAGPSAHPPGVRAAAVSGRRRNRCSCAGWLTPCRVAGCILAQTKNYHGPAVKPEHLSLYERWRGYGACLPAGWPPCMPSMSQWPVRACCYGTAPLAGRCAALATPSHQ